MTDTCRRAFAWPKCTISKLKKIHTNDIISEQQHIIWITVLLCDWLSTIWLQALAEVWKHTASLRCHCIRCLITLFMFIQPAQPAIMLQVPGSLVMLRCHFLKFDTITIWLLQKTAITDKISIFLQTQQPSQLGHCATVPTVGAGGRGWRPGERTGRWWSDAIISVSRSAPVLSAGAAFIQALHFVGEGKRVGRSLLIRTPRGASGVRIFRF